jgi:cation transport protein ChaC
MWVFGYGSLMWNKWEEPYDCQQKTTATLRGYRRDFIKKSVRNWGTPRSPCPTLGLVKADQTECVGIAFRIPANRKDDAYTYLSRREGPSFSLEEKDILLDSGSSIAALVAI